ncbi:MAG: ATP-binding cassette domain-containing protein [Planctomycetes bacterium]|nr:ATP-binding cassette domain-containing protein [Planctomycetota bacterium]
MSRSGLARGSRSPGRWRSWCRHGSGGEAPPVADAAASPAAGASAAGPDPAVEARDLTKVFHDPRRGPVVAANAVRFECRSGEVFGLLGPNGAGKTTTLRMLSTVLRPTSGTAVVAGHDVVQDPVAVRRAIGYLSSSTGLYGRLTARETLEYFGGLQGLAPDPLRERIGELVRGLGMEDFADVRCERLSTGMRQKVSIARALVHDPPVLILDEPTLGLDILVASAMLRFIQDCRARGKCIVFSTHVMSEVESLCDRVAIIHRGELRAVGTLEDLRRSTGREQVGDIFLALVEG